MSDDRPEYVPEELTCPRCGGEMEYVAKKRRLGEHCACECGLKYLVRPTEGSVGRLPAWTDDADTLQCTIEERIAIMREWSVHRHSLAGVRVSGARPCGLSDLVQRASPSSGRRGEGSGMEIPGDMSREGGTIFF